MLGFAALCPASPVNMLAVKSLLPDKGSLLALQLPLPAQRGDISGVAFSWLLLLAKRNYSAQDC